MMNLHFAGSDWVTGRMEHWLPHAGHLIGTPCQILTIGVYEARAEVWLLERGFLNHQHARLTSIDPWDAKLISDPVGGPQQEQRARRNLLATGKAAQVTLIKAYSHEALPLLAGPFDLIYVDGDHNGRAVIEDAVLCWRRLKPGALMILDDYRYTNNKRPHGETDPGPAIDAFLLLYATQLDLLHKDWQLIVRKKA